MRFPIIAALAVATLAPGARAQANAAFPLAVTSVTAVGADQAFGTLIAAKVGPGGEVYALDYMNATVTAFSPDGRVLWKTGRRGRGPGEFQRPYRLDVAPNGEIFVYDFESGEVTTLSPAGRFLRRVGFPFSFRTVDNLAVLANGELIVSGYSEATDGVSRHGLHRFRPAGGRLVHVASFGPLPAVRSREVLPYWGTGPVVRARNGDILYTPRFPYEIHRYDAAGRERAVVRPAAPLRGAPDDFIQIRHVGSRTEISSAEPELERPGIFTELNAGWILASRSGPRGKWWDLVGPDGRPRGSRAVPEEWGALIGFDRARGVLWLIGEHDDAPVLLRLRVSTARPARTN